MPSNQPLQSLFCIGEPVFRHSFSLSLCGTVKLFFLFFSEGGGVDYNIRSGHIIGTYLNIKKGSLSKIKTLW